MKPVFRRALLAAALPSLLAAAHVCAADAVPKKTPPAPGPVADAIGAMVRELGTATPPGMPAHQRLDALMTFRHSDATAAKLAKIYGSTPPWTLVRVPATAPGWTYRATLSPLHYADAADGSTVDWEAAISDIKVSADERKVTINSRWPSFTAADKTIRIHLRDATLNAQQERSADGLWFGQAHIDIAAVDFDPQGTGAAAAPRMSMQGMSFDTRLTDRQGKVDLGYKVGVKRIGVGADGVDEVKLATRVTGIDRQALLDMQALGERQAKLGAGSPEQQREALMPMLQAMAKSAIRSGTALEIDELGVSYHGQALRANGRLYLEGAVEADAANLPQLLKRLVLRLHVQAPVALLREVTRTLAEQQIKAKNKGVAEPQAVAQLAASMNDIALGKLVSGGFVRVDGEQLVSDIEYRGGLKINGKAVELPAIPGVGGAAGASASASAGVAAASPTFLKARRIDERCVLPDYPADVVKADSPLKLAMRLIVKADGSVRNVTLSSPSGRPEYDQAVLAAAARCVYIPALRNGQPIDMPEVWRVVREPGSVRP
jgi:TonB family protein